MSMELLLSFCFGNAESVRHQNHLPKRWLTHSLKTQEILAKKWALLRASPNGPRAVFAGFLCIFKFTGSAAPRLGWLTRCIERIFFVGRNIFWKLRLRLRLRIEYINTLSNHALEDNFLSMRAASWKMSFDLAMLLYHSGGISSMPYIIPARAPVTVAVVSVSLPRLTALSTVSW